MLRANIEKTINELKSNDSSLSCRTICNLVRNKYKCKVSKSTVASILKKNELNSPVGKRSIAVGRSSSEPMDYCGFYFLKAADICLQGSFWMATALSESCRLRQNIASLSDKFETAILGGMFHESDTEKFNEAVSKIVCKQYKKNAINTYLNSLEHVMPNKMAILDGVSKSLLGPGSVRLILSSGKNIDLDPRLRGFLSHNQTNSNFYSTYLNTTIYINNVMVACKQPFVFLSLEHGLADNVRFFDLCSAFGAPIVTNPPAFIQVLGQDRSVLSSLRISHAPRKFDFISGVLSSQEIARLQFSRVSAYVPFEHPLIWEKLYVAEAEAELSQHESNEHIMLRALLFKNYPGAETKLVLLTNMQRNYFSTHCIANSYFIKWPDFVQSFNNFSMLYLPEPDNFSVEMSEKLRNLFLMNELSIKSILIFAQELLYSYCRNSIFPPQWKQLDHEQVRGGIFALKGNVRQENGVLFVDFLVSNDYSLLSGLVSACAKVNDLGLLTRDGLRLFFKVKLS
jgi:hypothetical protein